jgi:hypothetical protein
LDKNNEKKSARFYYQLLTVGEDRYYLFMGIYRNAIESHLNVHAITIPISVISLLLLIVSENLVWQKMFCIPCDRKKDFKEEG